MKIFICQICGHVEFNKAPDACPVCMAPKEKFAQNDNIFADSKAKSPEGEAKHVPSIIVEKKCGLIQDAPCTDAHIRIGKVLHPMEAKHFIAFVDCYLDGVHVSRTMFSPNGIYAATALHVKEQGKKLTVVEMCNVHGYWMAEAQL
jgi:desulfoferrodoxin-like iron-binding protein